MTNPDCLHWVVVLLIVRCDGLTYSWRIYQSFFFKNLFYKQRTVHNHRRNIASASEN